MLKYNAIYHFWIHLSYKALVRNLRMRGCYDPDLFHDALLSVYDLLSENSGLELSDCRKLFDISYRRFYMNKSNGLNREITFEAGLLEIIIEKFQDHRDCITEYDRSALSYRIVRFIKTSFSKQDYDIFMLYTLNDSLSISKISMYTGLSPGKIYRKIENIKKEVQQNISLTKLKSKHYGTYYL